MTVFGKILTVVVLLLALAQAGLIVVFHVNQQKILKANKDYEGRHGLDQAELTTSKDELKRARDDRDNAVGVLANLTYKVKDPMNMQEVKDVEEARERAKKEKNLSDLIVDAEKQFKVLEGELSRNMTDLSRLNTRIQELTAQVNTGVVNISGSKDSLDRYSAEIKQLNDAVVARNQKITELLVAMNGLRDRAVKGEIDARAYQDRNQQLIEQLAQKDQENLRLRTVSAGGGFGGPVGAGNGPGPGGVGAGGGGAGASGGGAAGMVGQAAPFQRNPPQGNVEGLITKTDPATGMVSISIGSDSGVVKGNTLEVFRLNPPKYLGTIRILEHRPNEAVGKPVNKMLGQIMQGDRVASKILGN